ncbi:magnesium transporter [Natronorubrum sulfidifaciens]|uniref:MgtE integral membrane protein n=1 Tax=Natronorubrum sulfidifaciens JCM 14089 TaxID=1230460 RepID=L9WBG3_9EURY|nr:magnesium transporter [Natronorubrum sulfidifaciens]ELY46601.1 MgtE integral membrane protein [Natronorubrum sulfidifaciens JCM 14089]
MSAGGDVLHGEDLDDNPTTEWSVSSIVTTLVPLLVALSILQMVSGTVLETFEEQLLENPSLLILVPVMIGTAGNLGSIMCSRLATQLHLGTLEFSPTNPDIRSNVGAVMGLAATVFSLLGIASWLIGRALGGTLGLGTLLLITIVSGMLLAVWVVIVSTVSVYGSYRLGYDPDDTTIPVVTNICDITGVLILFGVVWVVL